MMRQFQVEASVKAVWFQKAEKVGLNEELHRKDIFAESDLFTWKKGSKVFHCWGEKQKEQNKQQKPTLPISIG